MTGESWSYIMCETAKIEVEVMSTRKKWTLGSGNFDAGFENSWCNVFVVNSRDDTASCGVVLSSLVYICKVVT